MPPNLTVTINNETRRFPCGTLLTIGRSKNNDISLPDPKVSRSHALVRCLGDGDYYLIDLGSANGTIVNGKRVLIPYALADSDVIRLGHHVLSFQMAEEIPSDAAAGDMEFTHPTMLTASSSVQEITLLVADIRNYTTLSEQIPVDLLSRTMARWFEMVSSLVEQNAGVIDKYIGDAVMIRWTTDQTHNIAASVRAAIKTALAMNLALGTLNAEFPQLPFPLKIGIGINSGQAILGNVGGGSRRDYTVLGDSVNLAFRLETASKTLQKDVVLAADCCRNLAGVSWEQYLSTVTVKGKKEAVNVCALNFDQLPLLQAEAPVPQG